MSLTPGVAARLLRMVERLFVPIGDPTSESESISYTDPVSGKPVKVMTFPADTAVIAWGIAGDAYPRVVFGADPNDPSSDGYLVSFGDGTEDPRVWGSVVYGNQNKMYLQGRVGDGGYGGAEWTRTNGADGVAMSAVKLWRWLQLDNTVSVGPFIRGCDHNPNSDSLGSGSLEGNVGDIVFARNGGVGATIWRCTTAGGHGAAVWTAIL